MWDFLLTLLALNQGKVAFDYNIGTGMLTRPGIVEAIPASGKIAAGGKETLKLRLCAGVPERLMETLLVEVAHFEPVQVQLVVEGVVPTITLNLPRVKDGLYASCFESAREKALASAAERAGGHSQSPSRSPSMSPRCGGEGGEGGTLGRGERVVQVRKEGGGGGPGEGGGPMGGGAVWGPGLSCLGWVGWGLFYFMRSESLLCVIR